MSAANAWYELRQPAPPYQQRFGEVKALVDILNVFRRSFEAKESDRDAEGKMGMPAPPELPPHVSLAKACELLGVSPDPIRVNAAFFIEQLPQLNGSVGRHRYFKELKVGKQ